MKRIIIGFLTALALAGAALAQQLPNVPANTFLCRGATPAQGGPVQACPFASMQTILFGNTSANFVLAGPTSGGAAPATLRKLVAADLPIGGVRTVLTADTTYFVNVSASTSPCGAFTCSAGSDSNSGLSATVPWKTIQHAINVINSTVDMAGFKVVIQLADGVYPEALTLAGYTGRGAAGQQFTDGFKTPIIAGHVGNHAAVIIAPTVAGYNSTTVWAEETAGLHWVFQNLSVKCNGVANIAFEIETFGYVQFNGVDFPDSCATAHMFIEDSGVGEIVGNYTISAGSAFHSFVALKGLLAILATDAQGGGALTVTMAGTPNFSGAFVGLASQGLVNVAAGAIYSGAATGTRWTRDTTSVIAIVADPNTIFPGNVNGKVTGPHFANSYSIYGATSGIASVSLFAVNTVVNFNSANTDNSIAIALPTGFTRYRVHQVFISGASQTLTTATAGLFTAAAGGGIAIVTSASAITVNTASENTNNNIQSMTVNNTNSQSFTASPLFFRVQTAQGAPATGTVTIVYQPLS